jgi:TonB-linked SusC/RagA family outer membrane protein
MAIGGPVSSRVFALPLAAIAAALPAAASAQQQARPVTGTVTATGTNQPLSDITITVAGTTTITRTNERGEFRVSVPAGDATIIARGIGFKRTPVRVAAGQSTVTVSLEKDVLQLEQMVVTGQTTTTERRNATTAVSVVSAEEVTRAPAPSLEGALQGKIVGANINLNSGAPGGGGQIQVRGVTSILGQGDPLFVVDGVIISNQGTSSGLNSITQASPGTSTIATIQDNVVNRLADINPNEIESIEVLKSAAATAIYGSRATNGVVVIRTKRGGAGAPRVNLTQRVGTQALLRTSGQRRFTSLDEALAWADLRGEDEELVTDLITASGGTPAFNDFQKQLYDNRDPSFETVASVSGGSDRTRYYVSGTQRKEEGTMRNTGARLQAARLNLDQTFTDRLKMTAGVNFTRNKLYRGVSNNDNTGNSPLYNFGYTPSFFNQQERDEAGNFVENPFNGGGSNWANPFQNVEFLGINEDVYRTIANGNVSYAAYASDRNRIELAGFVGIDRSQQESNVYSPGFLQFEAGDGLLGTQVQGNSSIRNVNTLLSATHTFTPTGGAYTVQTSLGSTYEEQGQNIYRLQGRATLPGVPRADVGTQAQQQTYSLFRDQSIYLNTQINAFGERLNVAGGARADRSSANGDPEKYYVFPRVSAAYRFDNVLPRMDNLKVRAAYGQTGNRPRYGDRDVLLQNGGIISGQTGIVANTLVGNTLIKPETLREQEYGFDVAAFDSRVQLEATYYDRTITDQLLQPPLAPSSGVSNVVINAGKLQNRGVELGLNLIPFTRGANTWTSRITYQANRQEVKDLPITVPAFPAPNSFGASYGRARITPGIRTTAIWGNAPVRLENGVPQEILPVGAFVTYTAPAGSTVAQRDTVIGDANPDFQMFFTNTFRVRNVSLNVLVDWRKGGDVVNMTQNLFDEGGNSRDWATSSGIVDARPVSASNPQTGDVMTLGDYRYNAWNGGRDARIYVQDGSFVKVREIALTYDVPTALTSRVSRQVSSLSVQLQARNPFMFTDYWGGDPEVSNFGNQNLNRFIDLAPYPPSRQFFLSFNVGF